MSPRLVLIGPPGAGKSTIGRRVANALELPLLDTDAEIERIFDPFVRIETSRSRETGGVGLGLSIARSIAQSHGGRIEAARRPEGGMRMSLFLPL